MYLSAARQRKMPVLSPSSRKREKVPDSCRLMKARVYEGAVLLDEPTVGAEVLEALPDNPKQVVSGAWRVVGGF